MQPLPLVLARLGELADLRRGLPASGTNRRSVWYMCFHTLSVALLRDELSPISDCHLEVIEKSLRVSGHFDQKLNMPSVVKARAPMSLFSMLFGFRTSYPVNW
jgi:hypothetical protein